MALLNLFKFLSPFIPQTKIESAKVNEQFSKIGDSMDTIAATLDRTPVYAAGTTFPSAANAGKAMVLDASGNPTFRAIGTAADLTATTSDTDSTAGRVLRVGNLGFGSQIAGIKEVYAAQTPADVLAVVGNNAHYTGNILNHGASAPEAWGIISGYITNGNSYSYSYEDFTGINGARYRRTAASASTWNTWRKVYEQGDLGSAAFLTSTTSPTDPAQGRAMRVGDFGLGAVIGPTETDPSAVRQNRIMSLNATWVTSPIAGTDAANQGQMLQIQHADPSYAVQVLYSLSLSAGDLVRRISNNVVGPWVRNITSANMVGTVVASGGSPSLFSAVIERGSNANGEYIKFADGTLICWGTPLVIANQLANGNVGTYGWSYYYENNSVLFPAVFTSAPSVQVTPQGAFLSALVTSVSATAFVVAPITTVLITAGAPIMYAAIGRWR